MATINRTFDVDWGLTGLAGTLAYRIVAGDDSVLVARTTTGVAEFPAGSGLYRAVVAVTDTWNARVVWDDGAGNYADESFGPLPPSASSINDLMTTAHGAGSWGGITVQGTASVPGAPPINGAEIDVYCNYPFHQAFELTLVDSTGWTQFVFTIKTSVEVRGDDSARVAVKVSDPAATDDGLFRLAGSAIVAPVTSADGSITVTQVATNTLLTVDITASGMSIPEGELVWELTRYIGDAKFLCGNGPLIATQVVRRSPDQEP